MRAADNDGYCLTLLSYYYTLVLHHMWSQQRNNQILWQDFSTRFPKRL